VHATDARIMIGSMPTHTFAAECAICSSDTARRNKHWCGCECVLYLIVPRRL